MRILGKHSHWWRKEEKEWVTQDKSGNWWLYKTKEIPEMKTRNKRTGQRSSVWKAEHYVMLALASALGISLAFNIIAMIS